MLPFCCKASPSRYITTDSFSGASIVCSSVEPKSPSLCESDEDIDELTPPHSLPHPCSSRRPLPPACSWAPPSCSPKWSCCCSPSLWDWPRCRMEMWRGGATTPWLCFPFFCLCCTQSSPCASTSSGTTSSTVWRKRGRLGREGGRGRSKTSRRDGTLYFVHTSSSSPFFIPPFPHYHQTRQSPLRTTMPKPKPAAAAAATSSRGSRACCRCAKGRKDICSFVCASQEKREIRKTKRKE